MATPLWVTGALTSALIVGLSASATPVVAQPMTEAELERITVVAPRITHQRERSGRVEVTTAEKSAFVNFGDLDLTRTADLYRLEDRVIQAAERVCSELADLYPDGEPSINVCINRAIDDAMVLVRQAARNEVAVAQSEWEE